MNQNQDRDIDEILASLDSLLRESESHNDDTHAESSVASDNQPELQDKLQDESAADMEQAFDQAVETVSDDGMETEESSEPMTRVVLTEDMLLENPQVSLPLGQSAKDDLGETVSDSNAPQAEVEHEPHADWDEQMMNQWAASVSQDIANQINQLLPDMIRDALQKKLAELQDEKHTKIQHNDE